MRLEALEARVLRAIVGLPRDAVGHVAPLDARQDLLHVRVIEAEDAEPVERNAVRELDERVLDVLVRAVVIEVLGVDVRDDGDRSA